MLGEKPATVAFCPVHMVWHVVALGVNELSLTVNLAVVIAPVAMHCKAVL